MTEQMCNQVLAAVKQAQEHTTFSSPEKLSSHLRATTHKLRQQYLLANQRQQRAPEEEWLCDNYYVLEKESKQSVKDIRHLAKKSAPGELVSLYEIFHRVLIQVQPPITDESLTVILKAVAQNRLISEKQFGFIPAAIKIVMVEMAYKACFEQHSPQMISYAIIGLSRLGAVDIEGIIHECSSVEAALLQDPAGVYPGMDSESRQYYRHLVARIAAKMKKPEDEIARDLLRQCSTQPEGDVRRHIGYPLVHSPYIVKPRLRRGKLALGLGIAVPLLLALGFSFLCRNPWLLFITFLPLWEICRTIIQHAITAGVGVDFIPRINLKKLTDKPKTVVLVSTLLPKPADAPQLKKRLEQLYFSNSDPDMYYCILADFGECQFPTDEKDESHIAAARRVLESLNQKHQNRFMLFLRARTYNKTQNRYSGWERKRGAITEFVRYVKGEKVSLHTFVGDSYVLPQIKYIIALDADTNLLYESAQTLVSAAIHPLNRPVIGSEGVVVEGYGILTPKISTDLESARSTAFSRVMTGCGGVTAYDTKDKDFYQDFFAETIFAGKGLIDLDCFYTLLSDRFPENQILSHDILEGAYLRVGFVSDAEMTDGAPQNMTSWLSRLHRWIRGDWQNICFTASRYKSGGKVYENPINTLSKYKLFDNLRRSLTPVASLLCLIAALFAPWPDSLILFLSGLLATTFASFWAAGWALITGGFFTLSRKFFTRTLPHAFELITQGLFFLIMLPAQALVTIDAASRSLWRLFVSHKNLLEWTTAAQGDMRQVTVGAVIRRYWLPELIGFGYLLLATQPIASLVGIVFILAAPVAHYSARTSPEYKYTLASSQRDVLIGYNAAMWRYYEEFANKRNNYLPPDNIQQSPVFRVAARTSPTNIGMMMLSVLAARDMDFIDTAGLFKRIDRTLTTVEKLRKWNGNLYNWYDTETLDTLKPEFVSSVDSGNFICCLVALAQGLKEFIPEKPAFQELIDRLNRIVEDCDIKAFYNSKKRLFAIGYDVDSQSLSESHYDFLMSEARLTSYYAVAKKIVGKKHWGTLNRTMSRCGSYAGSVSWTGTMFEYFMPHLLLPVYEGSLLGETLLYCLYCQKRRVKGMDLPWGISESAFYAFDNNLNYQYKAHGVQKIGVKRYLDSELVISPYSTFLTIPFNPNSSMENLRKLRELGVYGRYGFFEAVDFTAQRVGTGALAVTRSYMAHHIGMSMVASCNALFENRMQKRFMGDNTMKSAKEFLQEKIAKSTVVYDSLHQEGPREEKNDRSRMVRDESHFISPQAPRCTLLTNGEITDILTDTGAGYLKFGEVDLTRRSTDLLRRAQGVITLVRVGGNTIPATLAPFYDKDTRYSVEYQEQSVTYFARQKDIEVGVRCAIHPTISCQQRQIVVKNASSQKQLAQVLVYLEPILCRYNDYNAHPAYSKLFVGAEYDPETKTILFSRRNRDSSVDMYLTVGFLQDVDFTFETRRELLQTAPEGMTGLLDFYQKSFAQNDGGVPDACCAIKFDLLLPAGGQANATLLLCASRSRAEGIQGIISMRKIGVLDKSGAAKSPLLGDSLESRLGGVILGRLLFNQTAQPDNPAELRENRLGQSALWSTGISGDLPIALLELEEDYDPAVLEGYLKLHRSLHSLQVELDLCIVWNGSNDLEAAILDAISKNNVHGILGSRGGVFVLNKRQLPPEVLSLIRAVARYTATGTLPDLAPPQPPHFHPVAFRPITPAPMPEKPHLEVQGGAFAGGRFYVDKVSPLPYCHVLANGPFGTLVSDKALGYTWAINSRENKLTPWYNDICTDNTGEMLLLHDGDSTFDLVNGSRASFNKEDALYQGKTGKIQSQVQVTIAQTGCAKYMDVTLRNLSGKGKTVQCAYYTEPVLAVDRNTARYIVPTVLDREQVLLLENPYNTAVKCCAAIGVHTTGKAETPIFTTLRAPFLSGDWQAASCEVNNDPCAAVVVPVELPPGQAVQLRFTLSYGRTPEGAVYMATKELVSRVSPENTICIQTPDTALNQFINHFAPHQILASRIKGRTAFYQCGGAYGFRDQLQDCCAYLLLNPQIARRQIARCCSVQFVEGDVLHWWHPLPQSGGGLKGVRTRFSDDLIWLPFAVAEYVEKTGDKGILDIMVGYITAPILTPQEHEKYLSPQRAELREDIYHHCLRALDKGYNLDERGLPLIGCGDWNDGFSAVGLEGKGSSVFVALFLSWTLRKFAPICELRGDTSKAEECRMRSRQLQQAVDNHCWDGEWYIRAFFDSGEKMGSHSSSECSIDLLPQTFAVFSGMPDTQRVEQGMTSAYTRLVDPRLQLVRLFTPAFQYSHQNPGYVKAYLSGLRENGGQYTHSAVWFAMALLEMGRVEEGCAILRMLNPAHRSSDPKLAEIYKLEPYYMTADIYTNPHAPGRGGWSMYTGAASWYYRGVVETLLGLRVQGDKVRFSPRLPGDWPEAGLDLVLSGTPITVCIKPGEPGMVCDGKQAEWIPLDGTPHKVEVQTGVKVSEGNL